MKSLITKTLFNTRAQSITSKVKRLLPVKDLSLKEHDPVLYKLIEQEKFRQYRGIELIASENFTY